MKHFNIKTEPPPSNGMMLVALSGPHDVAQAATTALQHLLQQEGAVPFGDAHPDGLYIYSQVMPRMERHDGRVRVEWPRLELHHAPGGDPPGPVFLTGWRPHMGLLELSQELGQVAQLCGVRNVVHVTSGYGERAHTRPTIISALATAPEENTEIEELMRKLNPEPYARPREDPFLVQTCMIHRLGYLAVCGHVPHYINQAPNHQVAAELARRVRHFTRAAGNPLEELEERETEFQQAMQRATTENQVLAGMTLLAEQSEDRHRNGAEETAEEVERFLRMERKNRGTGGQPE